MRPDGTLIADSRVRMGAGGAVSTEPLPTAAPRGPVVGLVGRFYDDVLTLLPHSRAAHARCQPAGAGPTGSPMCGRKCG